MRREVHEALFHSMACLVVLLILVFDSLAWHCRVLRCFEWNHFRVRTGELTHEECVEFVESGHFPVVRCCIR